MRKQILFSILTLVMTTSAFAEREISKLQFVETESCDTADMAKTINVTANRVMFADENVSVLEDALSIKKDQKSMGTHAEVVSVKSKYDELEYAKSVDKAEAKANDGLVGVTAPVKYNVAYVVKSLVDGQEGVVGAGKFKVEVTCTVQEVNTMNEDGTVKLKADGTPETHLKYTGQLVSFEHKPKSIDGDNKAK